MIHFGLEVSAVYGVLEHFGSKESGKDFELYQAFMCNFLCETVLIFLIYIYILFTRRIDTFWSGGLETFWPKNQKRKIDKIHKDF